MLATTTRKEVGARRVLLSRNALGSNRFSLARLASALSHGVRPISENFTPSALPVGVRYLAACIRKKLPQPEYARVHVGDVLQFIKCAARFSNVINRKFRQPQVHIRIVQVLNPTYF